MKKAVIVVGPHFSGKSKTITKYFKPLVGLSGNERSFTLHEKSGTVLSQSLEEKRLGKVISQSVEEKRISSVADFLEKYMSCQWLILAARPASEPGSHYKEIVAILKRNGFAVATVEVTAGQSESFYKQRANEIHGHLV